MRYEFGDCVLDIETHELLRGGQPVKLRRKTFELLVHMMTHAGQGLSKQDLIDQAWSGRIVSDAVLNTSIKEVRQAIGDDGKEQSIVQTLHGYGYRFNAIPTSRQPIFSPTYRNTLPRFVTPFAGRTQELNALLQQLAIPECQLLTVIGPGGMGKTRLILQVAHCLIEQPVPDRFPDGVYWVDLSAAHSSNELVSAIAASLDCRLTESDPVQQLQAYLVSRRLLLVLDNFEQLKTHGNLLADWLVAAPHLVLLASSRTPLDLMPEWRFPLSGLNLENAEAHTLFNACAQRFDSQHDPHHPAITPICRLLGGIPLAIEMAATWLRLLSPDEIAEQLEQNLMLLDVQESSIEPRQANMYEVLAQSWRLLSTTEHETLRALAVFIGGFTLEAAQVITHARLATLAGLSDKSLLQRDPNKRYRVHELIRQYASEQLADHPEQSITLHRQHSHYYLEKLKATNRAEQRKLIQQLGSRESSNIQLAWSTAIKHSDWHLLESSLEALFDYCSIGGRYAQGVELFNLAQATIPTSEVALQRICQQRWMALRSLLGEQAIAYRYFRDLVERSELKPVERIFARSQLGQLAVWQDQAEHALPQLRAALSESQAINHTESQAQTAERLAQILSHLGQIDEALGLATKSLALWRELEYPDEIAVAHALDTLGFAAFCHGDFDHAENCYQESLGIFETHSDLNGKALALGGLGLIGSFCQAEEVAITQMQQAVALARQSGHRFHLVTRLALLAWGCSLLHRYDLALSAAKEGFRITQALGSNRYTIVVNYHFSEATLGLNDLGTSWNLLRQGLLLVRPEYSHEATRLLSSCAHWLVRYAEQCTEQERQLAY